MKFKILAAILFPAILSISSCHKNNDSNHAIVTKDEPKANYIFSDNERDALLKQRKEILSTSSLTYAGKTYQVQFGGEAHNNNILLMFQNPNNKSDKVSILFPIKPDDSSTCELGANNKVTQFSCTKDKMSQNEYIITYNATSLSSPENFILETSLYLASIGTTQFNKVKTGDGKYIINTSNPFSLIPFAETDLGVSSYLELNAILTSIGKGNDITLVFNNPIGGSSDDDLNMYTGLMIREYGLKTRISKTASVFSGGTDLFTAGVKRTIELKDDKKTVEQNKQIGVHSWSGDDDIEATKIPYTDESHRKQATYFKHMLGDKGVDFYLFTIKSAPADGEHYMTKEELKQYRILSE